MSLYSSEPKLGEYNFVLTIKCFPNHTYFTFTQALDDALRKKRTGEVPNKVEMPKKLLKTSSSTTVASKRHQKESAAASSSAGKPSSKTSQQQQEGAKFIPGSVLKERDVDEDGRIIGSIVKVTDKKGKSLLQSKVSAIGGSSKTLASSSYRLRSSATANPVSTIKSSRGDVSSRIPSTRGMRSDNILRRSEVVARDRDRDPPVDRDRRQQRRSRSGERDASPSPPALLSTRAQKPNRDDAAYRDYDRPTRSDSGYARDPESKMYSDVKPTRDRPHEYIPLTTRQDDHSKDAMPSQNHDSRRDQHDGRHSSRIDNKEPDMKPQFSSRRGDAEATMGPPSGDLMKPPRRRHRQSDEKKDASDPEKRSRSKSGEKAAAATTTSAVAGQKEPSPDPQKDNPAFLLKKDNGKTVTVTRAHLQSFKVHIKNRKRHPSDEISCAVDGYSVIGGDLEGGGRGGNSGGGGVPPRLSANDDFILSKTIPNEPEPYEEDEEDFPTEGEGEETRDENTEEREYDDRVSETNLGSPARYSDVEEEERGEPSSSPLPVLMGARSFRNVRPKSPSPFEEEESSLLDDEWEQQLQQEQEHLQQQHLRQLQQADERRFQRSGRRKSENTVEERQRVEEPAERVEETAQEVPPYESEEEGEPVPPPVIKRTAASTRQSLGETEPEPPGTEGRILLPHEQAAEDKRKAKEQKARERAERREKLKRRKAEKAAAAAAADAARAKAAAEEAARAKAAAKAEAAAEAAEAAKRAKKPVKISTDLLQAELEMSDWQDIVSKALDSKSLEDVGSQDDEDFQLAEEQASSKAGQKGSKKLKRPPPKNGSAPQRQQRRRQQSQQQQPSSPPSSQSPSDLNQESPKFLITFDGVDADKFAADDHDDDEIANSLVGGQKSKQTRNDAVEREKEKDEGMVLLDGFAEDDVFYIDADDVVEDDAEALSALVSGRTSPVTLSYVSSNQTLYSASDLSLPSEKGENELVKPSRSGAKISLPVRPKATKTAAVAAATDIAAARDATSTPAAAPPLAKATASVAPQVNGEKNQFTWQNPNAAVAAFAVGIGGNRNVTVAPRNLQATNARLNAARQVAMAPLRNVFSIPRSNQIPMRQVQSFAPPVPGNPPHSSTDRCRFWPACRAGEFLSTITILLRTIIL